jgi:hypothetical protein
MKALGCVITGVMKPISRVVLVCLVTSCAARAPKITANHPANPDAPTGRLAGAPPALRPGVVQYTTVPPLREGPPPASHEHHHGH